MLYSQTRNNSLATTSHKGLTGAASTWPRPFSETQLTEREKRVLKPSLIAARQAQMAEDAAQNAASELLEALEQTDSVEQAAVRLRVQHGLVRAPVSTRNTKAAGATRATGDFSYNVFSPTAASLAVLSGRLNALRWKLIDGAPTAADPSRGRASKLFLQRLPSIVKALFEASGLFSEKRPYRAMLKLGSAINQIEALDRIRHLRIKVRREVVYAGLLNAGTYISPGHVTIDGKPIGSAGKRPPSSGLTPLVVELLYESMTEAQEREYREQYRGLSDELRTLVEVIFALYQGDLVRNHDKLIAASIKDSLIQDAKYQNLVGVVKAQAEKVRAARAAHLASAARLTVAIEEADLLKELAQLDGATANDISTFREALKERILAGRDTASKSDDLARAVEEHQKADKSLSNHIRRVSADNAKAARLYNSATQLIQAKYDWWRQDPHTVGGEPLLRLVINTSNLRAWFIRLRAFYGRHGVSLPAADLEARGLTNLS